MKRLAWLFALGLAWPPSSASAHGRPLQIEHIAFDPRDPDHVVLSATVGLVVTSDGGASWRWTCASAFGADATQEDPDVLVTEDGSVVLTTFGGVVRGEPDLCDYTYPEGVVRNVFVVDVAPDPVSGGTVWGLTSSGVVPDRVVRSTDSGRSWAAVGAPIEEALLTERILLAPSDPSRVYVSAAIPPAGEVLRQAFLLRSTDGGESFERTELALVNGERLPHVVGVDPTDPDRLFVRMARGTVDPRPERLLYSDDGGRTFTSVLELPSLRGFAISADGQTVWAGSSTGRMGVWVARGGATVFEQVNDLDVRCLASRGDELWLCVDQRTGGFALGRSLDEGAVVGELLRFQDLEELVECPRCSASALGCPSWEPDLRGDIATYFGGVDGGTTGIPRDAGVPPECLPDASPEPPPPPPPGPEGCGCSAAGARGPSPLLALVLVTLTALRRGRRSAGPRGTPRR